MSVEEAEAKLNEAGEIRIQKTHVYFVAEAKATKLEKKHEKASRKSPARKTQKLAHEWHLAVMAAENARHELLQAVADEQEALLRYDSDKESADG